MEDLLRKGTYNSGGRPSEHYIGQRSFLKDNRGAIPPNVLIPPALETFAPLNFLSFANTATNDPYQVYCRANGIRPHPARMQPKLAEFFIEFLTDEEDLIMDSFAGSNTTGAMAEKLNRKWLSTELDSAYVKGEICHAPTVHCVLYNKPDNSCGHNSCPLCSVGVTIVGLLPNCTN